MLSNSDRYWLNRHRSTERKKLSELHQYEDGEDIIAWSSDGYNLAALWLEEDLDLPILDAARNLLEIVKTGFTPGSVHVDSVFSFLCPRTLAPDSTLEIFAVGNVVILSTSDIIPPTERCIGYLPLKEKSGYDGYTRLCRVNARRLRLALWGFRDYRNVQLKYRDATGPLVFGQWGDKMAILMPMSAGKSTNDH